MSWDESKHLREQLEKVTEERDKYERLYKQLFGLLLHSDTKLRGLLFGNDNDLPVIVTEPENSSETEK